MDVVLGSGPLGLAVSRALTGRGIPVTVVNSSGNSVAGHDSAQIQFVAGDIYAPVRMAPILAGARTVYQCAQPPYHQWVSNGTQLQQSVIDAVVAAGARLVVGENLYMYGRPDGPIHEETPMRPHTQKGCVREAQVRLLQRAEQEKRLQVAFVRGSDFFGPYVLNSMVGRHVFSSIIRGKPVLMPGDLHELHTYTYIDDFGHAMVNVGAADDTWGQVWHVPSAETTTTREFLRTAIRISAETSGHPTKHTRNSSILLKKTRTRSSAHYRT